MKTMKFYADNSSILSMWILPYIGTYMFLAIAFYLTLDINIGFVFLFSSVASYFVWISCKAKWRLHVENLGLSQDEIKDIETRHHASC
jgi:hypothetical protein